MENKKTNSQIENFVNGINSLKKETMSDDKGYMVFVYGEMEDGAQENCFASNGKLASLAECLYSCMKSHPTVAHVVIAAANAHAQSSLMEANARMAEMENKKNKKIVS
jgi:hypothetical protein